MKKIIALILLLSACSQAQAIDRKVMKQGDTLPPYYVTITDSSGVAVDLTGCTVTASMRADGNTLNAFTDAPAIIGIPTAGFFTFYFDATKTAKAGTYTIQFRITGPSGTFTIPTGTMAPVVIEEKY
jgi:hypothetical protein